MPPSRPRGGNPQHAHRFQKQDTHQGHAANGRQQAVAQAGGKTGLRAGKHGHQATNVGFHGVPGKGMVLGGTRWVL